MKTEKTAQTRQKVSSLETGKIFQNNADTFIDPYSFCKAALKPEHQPFKAEAQIITDALETVANGMNDPDTLKMLHEIDSSSIFKDWKAFILSLYYIYNNMFSQAKSELKNICENSLPFFIVPALKEIINWNRDSSKSLDKLTPPEAAIISDMLREYISFRKNINEALQALNQKNDHLFVDLITLVLTDIEQKDIFSAKKITVWALTQSFENGFSTEILIENIKLLFGEAESFRLIALSLTDIDPPLSFMFWIKTCLANIRQNLLDISQLEAYIQIFKETAKSVFKEKIDEEADAKLIESINSLLNLLLSELKSKFPDWKGCKEILRLIKLSEKSNSSYPKNLIKTGETDKNRDIFPVQLELFV